MNSMYKLVIFPVLTILFLAGCATHTPSGDTTPPDVSVTVESATGDNTFKAHDREYGPGENCIKVPSAPVRLSAKANDPEGMRVLSVKILPGKIIPGSVEISPVTSEVTHSVRSEDSTDIIDITVDPEATGNTTTELTASFEVKGDPPYAVTASAGDQSGNTSNVPQFSVRDSSDLTLCRGD